MIKRRGSVGIFPAMVGLGLILFSSTVPANPGGGYQCGVKRLKYNTLGTVTRWPKTSMTLRLPNREGVLRGTFRGARSGATGVNIPVKGRIREYRVHQGGNRYVLKGRWTWDFRRDGANGNAKGKFKLVIRKMAGRRYVIEGPVRIGYPGFIGNRWDLVGRLEGDN